MTPFLGQLEIGPLLAATIGLLMGAVGPLILAWINYKTNSATKKVLEEVKVVADQTKVVGDANHKIINQEKTDRENELRAQRTLSESLKEEILAMRARIEEMVRAKAIANHAATPPLPDRPKT